MADRSRRCAGPRARCRPISTLRTMSPACRRGRRRRATSRRLLGFDAEDFHSGEGRTARPRFDAWHGARRRGRVAAALQASDRRCPADRQRLCLAFTSAEPTTVLNVFPLDMAPAQSPPPASRRAPLQAYWFSQTIGLDRGLQSFLQAMARDQDARHPRHPRRRSAGAMARRLVELARELGIGDRVQFAAHGAARGDGAAGRRLRHRPVAGNRRQREPPASASPTRSSPICWPACRSC